MPIEAVRMRWHNSSAAVNFSPPWSTEGKRHVRGTGSLLRLHSIDKTSFFPSVLATLSSLSILLACCKLRGYVSSGGRIPESRESSARVIPRKAILFENKILATCARLSSTTYSPSRGGVASGINVWSFIRNPSQSSIAYLTQVSCGFSSTDQLRSSGRSRHLMISVPSSAFKNRQAKLKLVIVKLIANVCNFAKQTLRFFWLPARDRLCMDRLLVSLRLESSFQGATL